MKLMANQGRMTMSGLAKLSGVDISTVSRALNDSPLVNDKTKDHILKLATETGYAINARARNLRKQSSQTLGIVIPVYPGSQQNLSDPFFLEMIAAVSQAAAKFDYDLIINLPNSPSEIAERRLLLSGKADGLIIIGQAGRIERLRSLGDAADRVVVWGGMIDAADYTLVGSDNFEGGRLVGQHLKDIGRQRVVFLGDIDLPEVELRYNGLMSVWNGEGADQSVMHVRSSFDGHEAYRQTLALCESAHSFDAIFAASDVLAIAAIHAVQSKDLRVPEDVAVVGYDNIGQAAMISPGLTTIDQNIKLGGEILVNTLIEKIAGNPVSATLTPTKLVIRGSTVGG
jgi:DNA-binding LacI/PurR family transcriptional regulator